MFVLRNIALILNGIICTVPANTIHCPNAGLMLARRLRRLANINPTLGQYIKFAGLTYCGLKNIQNYTVSQSGTANLNRN